MRNNMILDYFTAHSLPVPAELATALEVLDMARAHLDATIIPEHSLYEATPHTVTKIVDGIVDARARADAIGASRQGIEHILSRRLVGSMRRSAEPLIAALGPLFDTHAATYLAAHGDLAGVVLTDAAIVEAGPATLDAYHRARTAAAELDTLVQVGEALRMHVMLEARAPALEYATRYVVVDTLEQAERVSNLLHESGPLEPWHSLADANARLHWHTIPEQRTIITNLDLPEPPAKKPPVDILVRQYLPEPAELR